MPAISVASRATESLPYDGGHQMNIEQLQEIRRYLVSLRGDQTLNLRSYATAIQNGFGGSTKELQEIVRREAEKLGVKYI